MKEVNMYSMQMQSFSDILDPPLVKFMEAEPMGMEGRWIQDRGKKETERDWFTSLAGESEVCREDYQRRDKFFCCSFGRVVAS